MAPGQEHATAVAETVSGDLLEFAREAESLCPLGAIRVHEER